MRAWYTYSCVGFVDFYYIQVYICFHPALLARTIYNIIFPLLLHWIECYDGRGGVQWIKECLFTKRVYVVWNGMELRSRILFVDGVGDDDRLRYGGVLYYLTRKYGIDAYVLSNHFADDGL